MEVPVFGNGPGLFYARKEMAMGLIWNGDGELAVIRTPTNKNVLPTGSATEGEPISRALEREFGAASGFLVKSHGGYMLGFCKELGRLQRIDWIVFQLRAHVKIADDVRRELFGGLTGEVQWLSPALAERRVRYEREKWAIRSFV